MKKIIICLLLILFVSPLATAEKITFNTEKVVWVMHDGSIQKSDKATKIRTFEVIGDYIYDSGIKTNGEIFGTDVPYKIYARGKEAILYNKLFGIINNPFSQPKIESCISAINIHSGLSPLAETLILGESFYILSRPLLGYDGFIIETGMKKER